MQYQVPSFENTDDIIERAAKLYLISSVANPNGSSTIVDALLLFGLNPNDVTNGGKCERCSHYVSKYMRYYMNHQIEITAELTIDDKKVVLRKLLELMYPYKIKNMRAIGNMAGFAISAGNQSKCKDYHICYRMFTKVYKELEKKESALKCNKIVLEQIDTTTTNLRVSQTMSPLMISPGSSSAGNSTLSTLTDPNNQHCHNSRSLQENLFENENFSSRQTSNGTTQSASRRVGSQRSVPDDENQSHINPDSFIGISSTR